MSEVVEVRSMRWSDTAEVFDDRSPLLIFLVDRLDETWCTVPEDLRDSLQTMQAASGTEVRVFEVDFRTEAGFLNLFGTGPRPAVVRKLPGEPTFERLRAAPTGGFSWVDLIEFCRPAYEWRPRFSVLGKGKRSTSGVSGEVVSRRA